MWQSGRGEYWLHALNHIIIPQRSSLWALPLCCWSLVSAVHTRELWPMILAGLLTGLMPQVQTHAFVAVAQWAVVFCLIRLELSWEYVSRWAAFGAVANFLALPQVIPYVARVTKTHGFLKINVI
jgi:hypothetical protein